VLPLRRYACKWVARAYERVAGVVRLSDRRGAGLGLTKGDGIFVERKSLEVGTGPIDSSMLVAQSNCRSSSGVVSAVV
jgi:hypothetical protein